jgi:hypothetical protein
MFLDMKILSYAIASQKAKYTTPIALQVRERENTIDLRPSSTKSPQYPPIKIQIVGWRNGLLYGR